MRCGPSRVSALASPAFITFSQSWFSEGQIELCELVFLLNSVCSGSPRPAPDRHESGACRCCALLYWHGLHLHWRKWEKQRQNISFRSSFSFCWWWAKPFIQYLYIYITTHIWPIYTYRLNTRKVGTWALHSSLHGWLNISIAPPMLVWNDTTRLNTKYQNMLPVFTPTYIQIFCFLSSQVCRRLRRIVYTQTGLSALPFHPLLTEVLWGTCPEHLCLEWSSITLTPVMLNVNTAVLSP